MQIVRLSFLQNFNSMRIFLSIYFDQTESADVGVLLSSLRLFKDKPDWQENLSTWDPAAFQDWMNGVNKTLYDLNIQTDPQKMFYDEWTSFLCMKNFLLLFYQEIPYDDIGNILQKLDTVQQNKNNIVWLEWLQAINLSINNRHLLDQPLTQ